MAIQRRQKQQLKLKLQSLTLGMGLKLDAQATSTSGRWKILLGEHLKEGLPCFDVVLVRSDFVVVDVHHFWAKGEEGSKEAAPQKANTYDTLRDEAIHRARAFYEQIVTKLQAKAQPEEGEEDKGLRVINPDGTEEDYTLN